MTAWVLTSAEARSPLGSRSSSRKPRAARLGFDGEVEAAVPFGEAFCFDQALLAHPGIALHAEADNMDGERCGFAAELLAEVARRAAARLFAVGEEHDQGGLGAVIEHPGGFRD